MFRRKPAGLLQRTPVAEWIAAGLGLVLTLGVLAILVREGLTDGEAPPSLSVVAEPPSATAGGFTVPVVVRNASAATAAQVEVRGELATGGQVEESHASFAYVPGRGEVRGGLVFQDDPRQGRLTVTAEGYEAP